MRLFILLCGFITSLSHALNIDELQQRFSQQDIIRADFIQLKTVKSFAKPLQSSGKMIIAKEQGLAWQQLKPFPMRMLLDNARMVQSINNQAPQVITADSNPQMFQFNHLLRALLQADKTQLERYFKMEFTAQSAHWELHLTPIATPLDKVFSHILLSGNNFVENIKLIDKQGDLTELVLSNHRLTPASLSADEQALFVIP